MIRWYQVRSRYASNGPPNAEPEIRDPRHENVRAARRVGATAKDRGLGKLETRVRRGMLTTLRPELHGSTLTEQSGKLSQR
jgi:hypothetical protein